MEFYAKPKRLSLTPISVSIPNGMEFYLALHIPLRRSWSFNSQRDEILLRYASGKRDEFAISIPNGIDYPFPLLAFAVADFVSIPKGIDYPLNLY